MLRKGNQMLHIGSGEIYANVSREDGDSLPSGVMRRPKILGNGLVIKSARVSVRNNTAPAVFFPSRDPKKMFDVPEKEKPAQEVEVQVTAPSEFQFVQVKRGKAEDAFADLGLIDVDDDIVETEVDETVEVTNAEANKPNLSEPEEVFEMLATKDIHSFGITKDDFAALNLTKKQVKRLYESVTGKSPNNQEGPALKKEIRKISMQSYANYKRVIAEIDKIRNPE